MRSVLRGRCERVWSEPSVERAPRSGMIHGVTEGSSTRVRHVALVLAAGALFGTAGTAASFGPDDASSASVGFLRLSLGALALFAIMPFVGGRWRNLPGLWRRPAI